MAYLVAFLKYIFFFFSLFSLILEFFFWRDYVEWLLYITGCFGSGISDQRDIRSGWFGHVAAVVGAAFLSAIWLLQTVMWLRPYCCCCEAKILVR